MVPNFGARSAEFRCLICRNVMVLPLTTPCAHNFCKSCLEGAFSGQTFVRQRTCEGRRTLRAQKNVMKCPSCPNDISDFLQNPQVCISKCEGIILSSLFYAHPTSYGWIIGFWLWASFLYLWIDIVCWIEWFINTCWSNRLIESWWMW